MTEEELVAIEEGRGTHCTQCGSSSTAMDAVPDLIAEVRRLRALPIIETCGACPASSSMPERWGPNGEEYGEVKVCGLDDALPAVDLAANPPVWCPLKAQQNQRDVK